MSPRSKASSDPHQPVHFDQSPSSGSFANHTQTHAPQRAMTDTQYIADTSHFMLDIDAESFPNAHGVQTAPPISSTQHRMATLASTESQTRNNKQLGVPRGSTLLGQEDQSSAAVPRDHLTCTAATEEPSPPMVDQMQPRADMPLCTSEYWDHGSLNPSASRYTLASSAAHDQRNVEAIVERATSNNSSIGAFRDMLSKYRYTPSGDQRSQSPAQLPLSLNSPLRKRRAPYDDIAASQVPNSTRSSSAERDGPRSTLTGMAMTDRDGYVPIPDLEDSMSDTERVYIPSEVASKTSCLPLAQKLISSSNYPHQSSRAPKLPAARLSPAATKDGQTAVSLTTLENPRSVMAIDELELLLVQRDLPRRSPDEDHAQLVARLHEIDNSLSAKELNALLREAYLPVSYPKIEKIRHLQKYDAENSRMGMQGVKATDAVFKQDYEGYKVHGITY